MDWNELAAFIEVAQEASFSKAAQLLHVTQPAVSKRIKSLEMRLDVRLFDRIGRTVHLTDAGRTLLPRARGILADLVDTEQLLRNTHGSVDGTLRLATSHHVGLHRLAPVLREFAYGYPAVKLDIRFEDSEAAHDLVAHADSELAVVTLDPLGPHGLHYLPVWDDPLTFIVGKNHALAVNPTASMEQLAGSPSILPGLATYTGRIVRRVFAEAGFDLAPEMSTNYLETIGMLVGIGLGWSVLPQTMVADALTPLTTDAPEMARTLGAVTNPDRTLSNAARAFIEVLTTFADPIT